MARPVILDGRAIAQRMKRELARELSSMPRKPTLAILAFDSPASKLYEQAQTKVANELGLVPIVEMLPFATATEAQIAKIIRDFNTTSFINGIFVHQPLPSHIDAQWVSTLIDPCKDVEGIHPQNSARRFFAKSRIGSCTALAVMELIESTGVDLKGKEVVVVGHSEIVGRPVSMLLLDTLATVTVCHVATKDLSAHVKRADVLVVAVGQPHLIKGAWIKHGAAVIDVGINVVEGKVVGDVEFDAAKERAAFISPVPGGVGPVTVMMVMKNTIEAFKLQHS